MKPGVNVIHRADQLISAGRKVSVALGMFDGVHVGHQRVLNQTVRDAQAAAGLAVAVTFDQHPNAVVAPDRSPPLIYSLPQRLRVIGSLGIDTVLLLHFDQSFSQQSGESFAAGLVRDFGDVASICVGGGFAFGHKRSGNVELLKDLGQKHRFVVHDIPPVSSHGLVVSSTRIREAIQAGKLASVNEMLARPYSVGGQVVRGEQLGRQLGFPTANLDISGLVLPPPGVYAGPVSVGGRTVRGVANIGYRPTLAQPQRVLRFEVHLLQFDGDLYQQELEFTFGRKLRDEQKFASLDALKEQIEKDVSAAQRWSD